MDPKNPIDSQDNSTFYGMPLDENIRTLRQFESLHNLNTLMRKARTLEEGYRLAVQCIDPARFSKVLLLIAEKVYPYGHVRKSNIGSAKGDPDNTNAIRGTAHYEDNVIVPKYLWIDGRIMSLSELLEEKDMMELEKVMVHHVDPESSHPLDRVMRGEELVIMKESLMESDQHSMCMTLFQLLNITDEVAMFPIEAKIESGTGPEGSDYFGILVAEKGDELMDEDDWDYLREYANIVGLALENSHLLENLERSIEELQEEKRFRDDIIMRMSHEINTPITSIKIMNDHIIGSVQNLMSQEFVPQDQYVKELTDILDSAKRIIINGSRLETLSKKLYNSILVQYKGMDVECLDVDIDQLVEKLLGVMKYNLIMNNATVRNHLQEASLPHICTDSDALTAVLEIVLENAIHYMPKDSSNRNTRDPEIDIHGRVERDDSGDHLVLSIQDNGIGFSETDLTRIFKRLYRVSKLEHHREKPGLGLPTAKDILDHLSGEIRPFSKPGEGSLFEIRLPLDQDPKD